MQITSEDLLNALLPDSGQSALVDLLRREIWVTGEVSDISRPVIRGLRQMSQFSNAPITVYVNTGGGDPIEAMAIADVMAALNNTLVVKTSVIGCSYSAGVLISAAGKKGHRSAMPSSDFLIHQLSVGHLGGKIDDIESTTTALVRLNDRIAKFLVEKTGAKLVRLKRLMEKESYLTPEEALRLGLIDRICVPGIYEGETHES